MTDDKSPIFYQFNNVLIPEIGTTRYDLLSCICRRRLQIAFFRPRSQSGWLDVIRSFHTSLILTA
eukprot:CAMPEP_0172449350 /NCGR_PEP_ID=MMETSP1065-20121228/8084_1 /TAXON_ID=265537 /ORGANISM="Amphiprora paludosa, Strain CCMP125" /LENGTH=64 /DNA_ID=CAMNT_0013201011 /DNA_START=511 /DNA_END=705 /DNA_ORIENTATION=-